MYWKKIRSDVSNEPRKDEETEHRTNTTQILHVGQSLRQRDSRYPLRALWTRRASSGMSKSKEDAYNA